MKTILLTIQIPIPLAAATTIFSHNPINAHQPTILCRPIKKNAPLPVPATTGIQCKKK